MGLVHKQPVHAQFLKSQSVVLVLDGGKFLEFAFKTLLGPFQHLDDPRVVFLGLLLDGKGQLPHLALNELLLRGVRDRNLLEA